MAWYALAELTNRNAHTHTHFLSRALTALPYPHLPVFFVYPKSLLVHILALLLGILSHGNPRSLAAVSSAILYFIDDLFLNYIWNYT